MKKSIGLKQKLFIICNSILVIAILSLYFGRLFYYKNKYDKAYQDATYTTFYKLLIDNIDLLEEKDGLFNNGDGSYTYRGNPNNNYCKYGGIIYRIIGIDEDGLVKIVSQDPITSYGMGEYEQFNSTSLFNWLNKTDEENSGHFYNCLIEPSMYLANVKANYNKISDLSNIDTTNIYNDAKVTILSVYDYLNAGGKDSYLNDGSCFWLSNIDASNNYYYIDDDGSLGVQYSKSMSLPVRVVMALNFTITAKSGHGTVNDPYIIDCPIAKTAQEAQIGDYIKYGDLLYRVSDKRENVRLIQEGALQQQHSFGSSNLFDLEDGIGYYLNNEFIEGLANYENILEADQKHFGLFGLYDDYSYQKAYQNAIECYVGLPNCDDMFLDSCQQSMLAMGSDQEDSLVYQIKENNYHCVDIDSPQDVRTVISINKDVDFVSGDGSINNPYVINLEFKRAQ